MYKVIQKHKPTSRTKCLRTGETSLNKTCCLVAQNQARSLFFDIRELVHHEFVPQTQTVNKEYFFVELKREKMRENGRNS